jgi:O-antigen ligase
MILLLCLSWIAVNKGLWSFKKAETKAFIALIIVSVLYTPLARNNFWALQISLSLITSFLTYMAIISFVNSKKRLRFFLNYWLFIGVLCAIKGIFDGGKIIGSGFLGDENDFALYLSMMLPIAYLNLFRENNSLFFKCFNIFSILAIGIGIISSSSRGGLIALASVILFCFFYTPKKFKIPIVLVGTIVLIISLKFTSEEYRKDMATIAEGANESTAGERLYSWHCGLKMFVDYPLFGVGPGNFPWRFAEYEPPEKWKGRSHGGRAAHSLYFTLIPEFGLTGIICFFTMLFSPLKRFKFQYRFFERNLSSDRNNHQIFSEYKLLRNIIFCTLVGYLTSGIFLSVLYYPHFWIIIGYLGALNLTMEKEIMEKFQAI